MSISCLVVFPHFIFFLILSVSYFCVNVYTVVLSLVQTDNGNFGRNSDNSFESSDDFERRLFGDVNNDKISDSFYRKLDKLEKAHGRSGTGSKLNSDDSRIIDGISDSFNSLSDGMDEKLKEAARTFVFSDEIHDENYKFRPDVTFYPGMTYTTRDLDLTKPGVQKRFKRNVFETTTQEVLKKADFRVGS
ncbi:hypothetical protein BHM03_00049904 [Ensete ventricosum]|uniref:Uncharacterized protein n=1 Tax=Ensete ventricosum TaxID=4639 RepID=A0A426X8L2_ENSVE|nr:hypothetical protein B296_00045452 [Ensete ventricosum]RZS17719.1 hypothetical protein BHM03_00049904 [Ensete ventricosum]